MNIDLIVYNYISGIDTNRVKIKECLTNLYFLLEKNKNFTDLKPSNLNYIASVYENGFVIDPIKEFYNEFFEKFTWKFLPNSFLYELYKAWHLDNLKGVSLVPRTTFINSLKFLIDKDIWMYSESALFLKTHCKKKEPIINKYDLNDWFIDLSSNDNYRSRGFIKKDLN